MPASTAVPRNARDGSRVSEPGDGRAAASDEERALLLRLLRARRDAAATGWTPLTATQQGIWLAEQADPGRSGYHDTAVVELIGDVDPGRLRSALAAVTQRHEALRCRLRQFDGEPRQAFDSSVTDVTLHELTRPSADASERLAARHTALAASEPFDLETGPLWRARVLKLEPGRFRVVLVVHHLIGDGWSHGVLWRDLLRAYLSDPHDVLPVVDGYASWLTAKVARERAAIASGRLGEVVRRVSATPRRTVLPGLADAATDRRAVAVQLPVSDAGWAGFHARCRACGSTPFAGLLGMFGAEAALRSGASVTMAVPFAQRAEPGADDLVGCLIDVLPVVLTLPGSEPELGADDPARIGQASWATALAAAEVPYREVARSLAVAKSHDADDPVTNVAVEQLNVDLTERRVGHLRVVPASRQHLRVRHDLTLTVPQRPDQRPHLLAPVERWRPDALADFAAGLGRRISRSAAPLDSAARSPRRTGR